MNCPLCHKRCTRPHVAAIRYQCTGDKHYFYYAEDYIFELQLHANKNLIVNIKRWHDSCYIFQSRTISGVLERLAPHQYIEPQTPQQAAKILNSYIKLTAFL